MAKKKAKATKRSTKPVPRKKAAKVVRKPLKTKKKASRKAASKPAAKAPVKKARRPAPKPLKKAATKVAKKVAKKVVKKVAVKAKTAVKAAKKPAPKPAPKPKPKAKARVQATPIALPVPARLQRERKRLPEVELEEFSGEGGDERLLSSARTGHDELRSELRLHTEASPELTAGDVDAKWQDAYAVGDETPGGDNMTPDQDRVDDIGKAMGVVYDDDEELMGGDEIAERDAHRWELDPASKDDEDE
jgi:hypothetical protein